eukprot:GHVU01096542.1.p1 GENE.GHVU01096542.1~~GHVU01096542.1.p1  ORF type:complete len:340 (-),score=58.40 GHVU01096542.1:1971-2990(-)
MDITGYVPEPLVRETGKKYLRIEMDKLGLDTTRGHIVSISAIKRQLPKLLQTGLWADAMEVFVRLVLQLEVPESHMQSVNAKMLGHANRYKLIKIEDIGKTLSFLSVEGLTYGTLRQIIGDMQLAFPEIEVKRTFNLMDINKDKSLTFLETIGGFNLLFSEFLPDLICNLVGLSAGKQAAVILGACIGLLLFFAFLGLAFASFAGMKSGMGSAVQSLLALGGAVGLQSTVSVDLDKVAADVKQRINGLFGEDMEARAEVYEALNAPKENEPVEVPDEGKPLGLSYSVPKKFIPDAEDPKLCVTFPPGADVQMIPSVAGIVKSGTLKYKVSPNFPPKLGL